MERGLDHLVLPARDLTALAETYRRLGFFVSGRNRHPWATENHIIQCPGTFLELLGFADDYLPLSDSDAAFPFAGFLAGYLARSEGGVAMTVLRSRDAAADARDFTLSGIGQGRLMPFSRSGRAPDGADKTVAFTLAFAEATAMPGIGFFTCQQHRPENFWNPAVQVHPNGTTAIAGIVIVASNPEACAPFLCTFTGRRETVEVSGGLSVKAEESRIEVLTPDAFHLRYGGELLIPDETPFIAGVLFTVAELRATQGFLQAAGISTSEREGMIIVTLPSTQRCTLIFAERG